MDESSPAPLCQAAQRQHRHFRWTAIANWQDHGSESARDIYLRVPAPSKSTQHSTPGPAGAALRGTPGNLTAVSMATENKIDICPRGASQNDWVMRQQQLHFIIARAGQSQRQIFQSNHRVIDAGQPERFALEIDAHA